MGPGRGLEAARGRGLPGDRPSGEDRPFFEGGQHHIAVKVNLSCNISPAEWPIAGSRCVRSYVAGAHAGRVQRGHADNRACREG